MTTRPILGLLATLLALCLLMWGWATMDRQAETPLEYLPPVVLAGLLVATVRALSEPEVIE